MKYRDLVDVVLAIDTSTSMDEPSNTGRRKLDVAVLAAESFVDLLRIDDGDRIALVSFDSVARVDQGLTDDRIAVIRALHGLRTSRESCLPCAMVASTAELTTNGSRESVPVIVVLSDGLSNPRTAEEAIDLAEEAKMNGIVICVIAFGVEVNEAALLAIASSQSTYVHSIHAEGLAAAYKNISSEILCESGP